MNRTKTKTYSIGLAALTVGVLLMTAGLVRHQHALSVLGAILGGGALGLPWRDGTRVRHAVSPSTAEAVPVPPATEAAASDTSGLTEPSPPFELPALVDHMLASDRYALLLRPQIVQDLAPRQAARAASALEAGMSLIPAGEMLVAASGSKVRVTSDQSNHAAKRPQRVWIDAVYIDRFAVSNRQYHQFVVSGGYAEHSLWDPEIWQMLSEFVDETGALGPRFWKNGKYERGWENHPVTGVNWFEASAYACWVGKRLPSDAEWIKAGAWPVTLPDGTQSERTFPWGDAMDRNRANLWRSGPGFTAPVEAFVAGGSAGDVRQLIGNVWEWTSGRLEDPDLLDSNSDTDNGSSFCSLRGGAFDTYFDAQATCRFQSGDHPLSRKHNIGFRCALGVCDLIIEQPAENFIHHESVQPAVTEVAADVHPLEMIA